MNAKQIQTLIKASDDEFADLEPHVLTDKTDVKVLPCRECQRPCVVTRFATPAKTACEDHRGRESRPEKLREFNESLEEHVLTDKDQTKRVPCRSCGRPCVVTTFMAPDKVACNECRGYVPQPKRTTVIKGDRKQVEEVTIFTTRDAQWSRFMVTMPFIDAVWTEEERAEYNKAQVQQMEAVTSKAALKRKQREAETRLYARVVPIDEADALEKKVSELENQIEPLEDKINRLREHRNRISRQAWLRAALERGWQVFRIEGDGYALRRGQAGEPMPLPDDYHDADYLAQVAV